MALSMLFVATAISFLITGLFGGTLQETIPFVMLGITVYGYLQQSLIEASTCLISARGHLLGSPLPYSTFVFSALLRNIMMVAHQFPAIIIVFLVIGLQPDLEWLWAIPGMVLVVGTAVGLGFFFSVVTARFRDIAPIVALVTGIGALLCPVYWRPDTLVKNQIIADANPITYLLAVARNPLMGESVTPETWIIAGLCCGVSLIMGVAAFMLCRSRLAFWI
jgi:ABC-type polysaccharide/polyol phosphate export permease